MTSKCIAGFALANLIVLVAVAAQYAAYNETRLTVAPIVAGFLAVGVGISAMASACFFTEDESK